MPKFCTNCGKPLMEGEVCSCQREGFQETMENTSPSKQQAYSTIYADGGNSSNFESQNMREATTFSQKPDDEPGTQHTFHAHQTPPFYDGAPGQQFQYGEAMPSSRPPQPSKVGIFFKNVGNFIGAFFKRPMDMVKAAVDHQDIGMGFFFAGINALFTALFLGVFMSRMGSIISSLLGGIGSVFGYGSMGLQLPFFPFFLSGLVMSVVGYLILSLLVFLVGKICKSQASFKGVAAGLGVSTFPATLCIVLATILSLLIPQWSIYAVLGALLLWIIHSYQATRTCLQPDENKTYFLYPLAFFVMYLFTSFIVGRILGWAIMQIFFRSGLW